ncbi:MAG: helix-turn-helix domain-containing protein [Actinomycetota bacterium]
MQRGLTELGPSLRKVRSARGLTLAPAPRAPRLPPALPEALEGDEFDRLLGDVHVRGCLRTYASYLRLSPDKVVAAYAAGRTDAPPQTPSAAPLQPESVMGGSRRRDNHRLIGMAAATLLVLAGAFGVLSARQPAPPPAELPSEAPAMVTTARPITVAVLARQPVEVRIVADDAPVQTFHLEVGEGRSFDGDRSVTVRLSEGGTAQITVNGSDEGFPGQAGRPWRRTYSYATASPTP